MQFLLYFTYTINKVSSTSANYVQGDCEKTMNAYMPNCKLAMIAGSALSQSANNSEIKHIL
jgi:hypothetical protein